MSLTSLSKKFSTIPGSCAAELLQLPGVKMEQDLAGSVETPRFFLSLQGSKSEH